MYRNVIICLLAISSIAHGQDSAPKAQPLHLFILSGTSNMERMNQEADFIPLLQNEFGENAILVVKDTHSANPICRWYRDWVPPPNRRAKNETCGDLYDQLIDKVRVALNGQTPDTITLVWMQGEDDARIACGEVYEQSLRGLFDQLRRDFGRKDIRFVIGRISDHDPRNSRTPHWALVRKAQVAVADSDPLVEWVDTDDLNGEDNELHYPPEGSVELGRRFALAAIRLNQTPP